ncbi:MAG: hypothetical protein ACI3T9_03870 [Romboutsia timonensis]
MELNFKSKRQKADFEKMAQNIYFDFDNDVKQNGLGDILINLDFLDNQELTELENFIIKYNNKVKKQNICLNKTRKMLSIS